MLTFNQAQELLDSMSTNIRTHAELTLTYKLDPTKDFLEGRRRADQLADLQAQVAHEYSELVGYAHDADRLRRGQRPS